MGALELVFSGDAKLFGIVALSLFVTLSATVAACVVGLPLGALVALTRFPGRNALIVFLNGCMGLPPVVVGPAGLSAAVALRAARAASGCCSLRAR